MKKFIYNQMVDREDFADRDADIAYLKRMLSRDKKIALYAPRRYGKSSLAALVLPSELKESGVATLYVDFMGCVGMESVSKRLSEALFKTLNTYFKKKFLIKTAASYLKNLGLGFSADPLTGEMGFELLARRDNFPTLTQVLEAIVELANREKLLICLDEFQDISEIPEALALFRSHLQRLKKCPILFLGSKRKLLAQIFSSQHSPFFNFTDEYVLQPIPIEEWKTFFHDRLRSSKIKIADKALGRICDEVMNVPNSICEVGAFIQDNYFEQVINEDDIPKIFAHLLDSKIEGYRFQLSMLTKNEIQFCQAIAQFGFVESLTSRDFLQVARMGASSAQKVMKKLYRLGIVEEEAKGIRLSNPLLSIFLKYRAV